MAKVPEKSASGEMATVKKIANLQGRPESGGAPDPKLKQAVRAACGNKGGKC